MRPYEILNHHQCITCSGWQSACCRCRKLSNVLLWTGSAAKCILAAENGPPNKKNPYPFQCTPYLTGFHHFTLPTDTFLTRKCCYISQILLSPSKHSFGRNNHFCPTNNRSCCSDCNKRPVCAKVTL